MKNDLLFRSQFFSSEILSKPGVGVFGCRGTSWFNRENLNGRMENTRLTIRKQKGDLRKTATYSHINFNNKKREEKLGISNVC